MILYYIIGAWGLVFILLWVLFRALEKAYYDFYDRFDEDE